MAVLLIILCSLWLVVPTMMIMKGIIGIFKTTSWVSLAGSFLMGSTFSIILSCVANILLTTLPLMDGGQMDIILLFIKTILVALAQPTITGIVVLSILCFLSMAAAKLVAMLEDISVLIKAHKEVIDYSESKKSKSQH